MGSVVSIENSVHNPIGLGLCRTAISRELAVLVSLMNRMVANQVWVERSNQQRGSLVNSLAPTLNRSLTLNGPRSDFPAVLKMRYAELTGSRMKPLPSHRPWSGGSNICSKLVTWLSRLPTPLKLTRGELVFVAAPLPRPPRPAR